MMVVDDSAVSVTFGSGYGSGEVTQPAPSPYTWTPPRTKDYPEVIVDTGTQPSAPPAATPGAGPCNTCGGATPPPYQPPAPGPGGPAPTPATTPAATGKLSGLPWWVWPLAFLAFAGTVNRA